MTKVDIFSGFLGAGKTTLIKKLIAEAYGGEKIVLIENEFGEIGVDKGFLKDTGVEINEMNAGCICCTLVGDFGRALNEVIETYNPERILIEPSGVGKLSDVIIAVQDLDNARISLNSFTTVVDAKKCKMYMKNFGEFYINQVEHAGSIILSHTDGLSENKLNQCIGLLREHNQEASIVTTPWDDISGSQLVEIMEQKKTLSAELEHLRQEVYAEQAAHEAKHEHHDHDYDHAQHDHDCDCHDHAHHDHDCDCHDHAHHDHDCDCHDHDYHGHDHEHHDHGHSHEGHHHADEVFDEIGIQTANKYTKEQLMEAMAGLQNFAECGQVLRAKGIVPGEDGKWFELDYVPGEPEVREGGAEPIGMICVIGVGLEEERIRELFRL